jgi:hypothetical protein
MLGKDLDLKHATLCHLPALMLSIHTPLLCSASLPDAENIQNKFYVNQLSREP